MMYKPKGVRQTHPKSRNGCAECKGRRVKCDEGFPTCSNCVRRRSGNCTYDVPRDKDAPASTPKKNSPPVIHESGTTYDVLTIELIHHWITATSTTLPCYRWTPPGFIIQLPKLGLKDPSVMSCILAITALHLHVLGLGSNQDVDYWAISRRHLQEAIQHLPQARSSDRTHSSRFVLDGQPYEVACHVLSVYFMALPQDPSQKTLTTPYSTWLKTSREYFAATAGHWRLKIQTLEDPWSGISHGIIPCHLAVAVPPALEELCRLGSELPEEAIYRDAVDRLVETIALSAHPSFQAASLVYWPAVVSDAFLQLIYEARPRALVILAYFLALVGRQRGLWWVRGRGERDLGIIRETLVDSGETEWLPWLDEPNRIAQQSVDLLEDSSPVSSTIY